MYPNGEIWFAAPFPGPVLFLAHLDSPGRYSPGLYPMDSHPAPAQPTNTKRPRSPAESSAPIETMRDVRDRKSQPSARSTLARIGFSSLSDYPIELRRRFLSLSLHPIHRFAC